MLEVGQDGQVHLRGRLDMQNVGELAMPLAAQAAQHPLLTIDLSGVDKADSAALALLLNTLRAARAKNHQLRIENWPHSLRSLLPLYGLDELLLPDVGDA